MVAGGTHIEDADVLRSGATSLGSVAPSHGVVGARDVLVRLPVRSCPPTGRGARRGAWSGLVPRGRTSPWRSVRTRLFSVPGRLVSCSRTPTLRTPPEWPWTDASSRPQLPTMPPTRHAVASESRSRRTADDGISADNGFEPLNVCLAAPRVPVSRRIRLGTVRCQRNMTTSSVHLRIFSRSRLIDNEMGIRGDHRRNGCICYPSPNRGR
jgi:hypothetical protein